MFDNNICKEVCGCLNNPNKTVNSLSAKLESCKITDVVDIVQEDFMTVTTITFLHHFYTQFSPTVVMKTSSVAVLNSRKIPCIAMIYYERLNIFMHHM